MSLFEAIILGILQGATEFLPISSSGHLVLVPAILGLTQPSLTLIAIAHGGTLLAVLIFFRREIWAIIKAVLSGLWQRNPLGSDDARLGWYIVVGSIPAAIVGSLFNDYFERDFQQCHLRRIFLIGHGSSAGFGREDVKRNQTPGSDDLVRYHSYRPFSDVGANSWDISQWQHYHCRNLARIRPGDGRKI